MKIGHKSQFLRSFDFKNARHHWKRWYTRTLPVRRQLWCNVPLQVSTTVSQVSWIGCACCARRSMKDLGLRNLAPRVTPSRRVLTLKTAPSFPKYGFFSSDVMITTFPFRSVVAVAPVLQKVFFSEPAQVHIRQATVMHPCSSANTSFPFCDRSL